MSDVNPELVLALTRGDRKGRFEIVNEDGRLFVPLEALGWFLDEVDDRMCAIADRLEALEGGGRRSRRATHCDGADISFHRDLIDNTGGYDSGDDMFNGSGGLF